MRTEVKVLLVVCETCGGEFIEDCMVERATNYTGFVDEEVCCPYCGEEEKFTLRG